MRARMPPRQKSLRKQTKSLQRRERSKCATNRPERVQEWRIPRRNYWITSSARAISEGGTVRPSSFGRVGENSTSHFRRSLSVSAVSGCVPV